MRHPDRDGYHRLFLPHGIVVLIPCEGSRCPCQDKIAVLDPRLKQMFERPSVGEEL